MDLINIFDYENINLDLQVNEYKEIEIKQLDSRMLHFTIYNNGVLVDLTPYSIEFRVTKTNGRYCIQTSRMDLSNKNLGIIGIELDETITNWSGRANCELQFINNNTQKRITTFDILLIINQSVIDNMIEESDSITILQEINETMGEGTVLLQSLQKENINADENIQELKDLTTLGETIYENISNANTVASINIPLLKEQNDKVPTNLKNLDSSNSLSVINYNNLTSTNNKATINISNLSNENVKAIDNVNQLKELKNNINENNTMAEKNIEELKSINNTSKELLPLPNEVSHVMMNIMGMALFTERNMSIAYTGAYRNMEIFSLLTKDNLFLENSVYDESTHKVNLANGNIEGFAFSYE